MQKLGQHFLTNRDILWKIADAVDAEVFDTIIEIGPGHGELTSKLVNKFLSLKVDKSIHSKAHKVRLILVERDKELAEQLRTTITTQWKDYQDSIEIIEDDILRVLPTLSDAFSPARYVIIGNIPYYITGHLLRVVEELSHKPLQAVFLIQKEVAERVCAEPPRMNLLAASVQIWASPSLLFSVGKQEFSPPPKVESAVLKLEVGNQKLEDLNAYYRFIKILFKQPRKTILNNLVAGSKEGVVSSKYKVSSMGRGEIEEILKKYKVDPKGRPQDLSVEQIIKLTEAFF